ncbi:MAG TPA: hypothetical protein PLV92_13520 [Pirellulaceae bacterium]|nr:hypothetical protein [Pirellulaceae bacterium]
MSFQPTTPLTVQSQPNSPQPNQLNQPSQPNPSANGQGVQGQGASGQAGPPQGAAGQTQSVAAQPSAGTPTSAQPTAAAPATGSQSATQTGSTPPGAVPPSSTTIGGANTGGSQPAGADERSRGDDRNDRDERPAGRPVGDPPTGVAVKRLVVGPFDPKWEQMADVRRFESLSEAMRATIELPEADTIELHYDGERVSEPLDVSPPSRRLTIRAGAGHTPIVHFKPEEAELVTDRRLIRVVHSAVSFTRVQLVVTLPAEPYDDWALFYLDRATRVELNDATLTLRNTERGGAPLHRAAFFEFAAPQAAETMMDMKNVRDAAPPWVNLQNCIARGQATLVRATSGVPFRLTWNQGLFVSTESLVQTAGARTQPQPSEGIGIELSQVTVAIGRTLCLMRIEPGARFPLELVTKFNNCIFLESAGARGDGAPLTLVEQQYAVGIEPSRKRPFLSGAGNYYPNDTVLLRIAPAGQPGGAVEYSLQDRDEARQEKWYDEQPSVGMVMWKQLPDSSAPVDRLTKDDFQLDDAPNNPAARAGFDRRSLPETAR